MADEAFLFVAGNNVLAIHVINSIVDVLFDLNFGDMLLLPQLVSRIVTVLPNEPGGVLYYNLVQSDEASGQHEYNDVKLVDELFSKL